MSDKYWCQWCKKKKSHLEMACLDMFNGCTCNDCYQNHKEDLKVQAKEIKQELLEVPE